MWTSWVSMRILSAGVAGVMTLGMMKAGCGTPSDPPPEGQICVLPSGDDASSLSQYDTAGCIEYQPGSMPLILSMPHGGYLLPDELPDRTQGTTVNDGVTQELGREVADAIEARTGKRPYLIINRLDRVKLDPNREIDEAAEGDAGAEAEWHAYHGYIEGALEEVRQMGGIGFYVDLHGQSHDPGRTQLGFSTTADNMKLSDAQLDAGGYAQWSSLIPYVDKGAARFSQLLRGQTSLGGRLEAAGYHAVPSPVSPSPGDDVTYWNTGYSSYVHGPLQEAPWVGSVLCETAYDGIRDTIPHRKAFAEVLADALLGFMSDNG